LGFPDPYSNSPGWDINKRSKDCEVCVDNDVAYNNCKSCPLGGVCGQTRQSPINLSRDRGLYHGENVKECPDWHHMKYHDGACSWEDLVDNDKSIHKNNFLIRRHALQILQPLNEAGELQCNDPALGGQAFPELDYSKGFPNFWQLSHTEISVPSQHTQEGKRYDAEISLAHAYENGDIPKNEVGFFDYWNYLYSMIYANNISQLGIVSIFLEGDDNLKPWGMLDKLICQWRETEEQVREACGLESVKTFYPGCTNYVRGHAAVDSPPPISPVAPTAPISSTPQITTAPTMVSLDLPSQSLSPSTEEHFSFEPKVFPKCNICGNESLAVTNLNGTLNVPGFPKLTCRLMEIAGLHGHLNPTFCPLFPTFTDDCSCQLIQSNLTVDEGRTGAIASYGNTSGYSNETQMNDLAIPPTISCDARSGNEDVNYRRVCKSCCDSDKRSATGFCHETYSFFGEDMDSVCYHCCDPHEIVAPAPPPSPKYNPIDCSKVENPFRLCNEDTNTSCCREERSGTQFCRDTYDKYGDDKMGSICWYCCSTPIILGPSIPDKGNRRLRVESQTIGSEISHAIGKSELVERNIAQKKRDMHSEARIQALHHPMAEARVKYLKIPKRNQNYIEEEDEVFFSNMMKRHMENESKDLNEQEMRRRRLVNYEHVDYWPYEWLLKVKTEYYFRYEGTLTVPPCKDQVHWRVLKDPIYVARRQIDELHRLMQERISPQDSEFKQCQPDHAGSPRPGNPEKFDFMRPLQENHKLHRLVFCECKDWKSLFPSDKEWCKRGIRERFYDHPYNFISDGF
jgi:Eukaryotic-type carbonic anhydrase